MPKVRDAIRIVEGDGWRVVVTKGSHRQFKHASKSGRVTIAGHTSREVPPGIWASIMRQAGLKERM